MANITFTNIFQHIISGSRMNDTFLSNPSNLYNINSRGMVEVPCLISGAACGTDAPFNDGFVLEEIPVEIYAKTKTPILVNAFGDSMEPLFSPGDKLLIETAERYKNLDIIFGYFNGNRIIKRIRKTKDGIFLDSFNKKYEPIKLQDDDELVIHGYVKYNIRTVSPGDFTW